MYSKKVGKRFGELTPPVGYPSRLYTNQNTYVGDRKKLSIYLNTNYTYKNQPLALASECHNHSEIGKNKL